MINIFKKNAIYIISIFLVISITSFVFNVKAHAPTNMELTYNKNTEVLTIELTHDIGSDFPDLHYIKEIEVKVNEQWYSTHYYYSHPGLSEMTYNYNVTLPNQEVNRIGVIARCSIEGSAYKELYVWDDDDDIVSTKGRKKNQAISGYFGYWLIIGVSLITLLILMQKKIKW